MTFIRLPYRIGIVVLILALLAISFYVTGFASVDGLPVQSGHFQSSLITPTPSGTVILDVRYYRDIAGVPDGLIADATVTQGDSFFVEVRASDQRLQPAGVIALSVDLKWDPALMQEIDTPFDPSDIASLLVTSDFPLQRGGSLNSIAGTVDELRGGSLPIATLGDAIGIGAPERFAVLHFRALAPTAATPFTVTLGSAGIALADAANNFALDIQPSTLQIMQGPPRITDSSGDPLDASIQFVTSFAGYRPGMPDSPLVRPALGSRTEFVTLTNTSIVPLTIVSLQLNAPNVTMVPTAPITAPIVIPPAGSRVISLRYVPVLPSLADPTLESFELTAGLVIQSDLALGGTRTVTLRGRSTFNSDINYDEVVNLADFGPLNVVWGLCSGDPGWDPTADINGDGCANFDDLGVFNAEFGRNYPTPGPGTTATPTPTATPTGTPPAACPNLVLNGGFEAGTSWGIPLTAHSAGYSTAQPYAGTRSLRTGVVTYPDVYSYSDAYQIVYIPANAVAPRLSFRWYPQSAEGTLPAGAADLMQPSQDVLQGLADHTLPLGALGTDLQYLMVLTRTGGRIADLLWTRSDARSWQYATYDLSAYRGQEIRLQFGTYNDGDGLRTSMYIDEVTLTTCAVAADMALAVPDSAPAHAYANPAAADALQVTTRLYRDVNGVPGSIIPGNLVDPGESFFVELLVEDMRPDSAGINGLALDLAWDPARLAVIDNPFAPANAQSPLVTNAFPLLRGGTLNQGQGTVVGLKGGSLPRGGQGQAIGAGAPARFSLLHFQAKDTEGAATLAVTLGALRAGLADGQAAKPEVQGAQLMIGGCSNYLPMFTR